MGANCLSSLSRNKSDRRESIEKKSRCVPIKETGVSEIDEFFQAADELLSTVASIHQKLSKSLKRFLKATWAKVLSNPSAEDGVMAMLYSYSAGSNGDLSKIQLEIQIEQPYIKVADDSLREEHQIISHTWNELLRAIEEAVARAPKLVGELQTFIEGTEQFIDRVKEIVGNSGLGRAEQLKVLRTVNENVNSTKEGMRLLTAARNLSARLSADIGRLNFKLTNEEEMSQVREIGRRAHSEGVFEPKKIVMSYWPEESRIKHK